MKIVHVSEQRESITEELASEVCAAWLALEHATPLQLWDAFSDIVLPGWPAQAQRMIWRAAAIKYNTAKGITE